MVDIVTNSDTSEGTHLEDEATPQELDAPIDTPIAQFGLQDSGWTDADWRALLESLVDSHVGSWKDIAVLTLGQLNPSQVGTSLASSDGFKRRYGKGNTMSVVMDWFYKQSGRCEDCGSRLDLQADHIQGREGFSDPLDADFIENMTLRCRRCNVVRRPSHEFGGLTHLTAEAALMWIMLVIKPRTLRDFIRLCRLYGMTMADIRMQEAWAMAHWLAHQDSPAYGIEDDSNSLYDVILWPDNAITRIDPTIDSHEGSTRLYESVPGSNVLGILAIPPDGRLKFYEQSLDFIPFSTYQLGNREPQALAIHYSPPKGGTGQRISGLAPRNCDLVAHAMRSADQRFRAFNLDSPSYMQMMDKTSSVGRRVRDTGGRTTWRLEPVNITPTLFQPD